MEPLPTQNITAFSNYTAFLKKRSFWWLFLVITYQVGIVMSIVGKNATSLFLLAFPIGLMILAVKKPATKKWLAAFTLLCLVCTVIEVFLIWELPSTGWNGFFAPLLPFILVNDNLLMPVFSWGFQFIFVYPIFYLFRLFFLVLSAACLFFAPKLPRFVLIFSFFFYSVSSILFFMTLAQQGSRYMGLP